MNWDALGAIGELVGAVAVVLTLGYLAVQIRQSGRTSIQQSYNDIVSRRSEFYYTLVESDEVTEIIIAGFRGDKMDPIKAQRYTSAMLNFVSHVQDVYLQRELGLVEERVWQAERQQMAAAVGAPGFIEWWSMADQYFLPEFVKEVNSVEPIPLVVMNQDTGKWIRDTWR